MKKTIFFGGKKIGYKCLQSLCEEPEIEVSLIVSNTCDLYGGEDRWYPKIYELAKSYGIPYVATDKPNAANMISMIEGISPNLMFVVYYDNILKQELFELAQDGVINLHLADAEKYRGCYPTTFAIINGEKEYGVTLHYIDKGVDTGPIIDKELFELKQEWIGKDLYDVATEKGYKLFKRNLNNIIKKNIEPKIQKSSTHIKSYKRPQFPSHEIAFEGSAKDVLNCIRALIFPPFPSPYFYIGDRKFEISEVQDSSRQDG